MVYKLAFLSHDLLFLESILHIDFHAVTHLSSVQIQCPRDEAIHNMAARQMTEL